MMIFVIFWYILFQFHCVFSNPFAILPSPSIPAVAPTPAVISTNPCLLLLLLFFLTFHPPWRFCPPCDKRTTRDSRVEGAGWAWSSFTSPGVASTKTCSKKFPGFAIMEIFFFFVYVRFSPSAWPESLSRFPPTYAQQTLVAIQPV